MKISKRQSKRLLKALFKLKEQGVNNEELEIFLIEKVEWFGEVKERVGRKYLSKIEHGATEFFDILKTINKK
jgi:hypothetical protein